MWLLLPVPGGCRIKKLRDGFLVGMGSRSRFVRATKSVTGSAGAASCWQLGGHRRILVFCSPLGRVEHDRL